MKTIDIIADGIGHVDVIEFDPEKPLLNDYVRVQVTLDLNLPLRDKKISHITWRQSGICGCGVRKS